ncbi:DNA gyrase inhibitor YacG [Paracoccus cavernae]
MAAKCPICGKPSTAEYAPFCSKRCADIDLAHWLRGDYRIPAEPASENIPEE